MTATRIPGGRLAALLCLAALPVLLVSLGWIVFGSALRSDAVRLWIRPQYLSHLIYAAANWVVIGAALAIGGRTLREAGLRFSWTRKNARMAIFGFLLGPAVFATVNAFLAMTGLPKVAGMHFASPNALEIAALVIGPVLTAPLSEEILFRSIWIGALSQRVKVPLAVTLSTLAFAAIHYPYFGLGGVIFISVWGLIPAVLFVRTGDLAAPLAMHVANNIFAYLIAPFFLPQL